MHKTLEKLASLILAVGLVLGVAGIAKSYSIPAPPKVAPPSPPALTQEELSRLPQNGHEIFVSGPETAGSEIKIGGKWTKLPADVYVEDYYVAVRCWVGEECPESPQYVLAKGPARFVVGAKSGKVLKRITPSGHENAFDFLKGAVVE